MSMACYKVSGGQWILKNNLLYIHKLLRIITVRKGLESTSAFEDMDIKKHSLNKRHTHSV